jgi:hypothetical protein
MILNDDYNFSVLLYLLRRSKLTIFGKKKNLFPGRILWVRGYVNHVYVICVNKEGSFHSQLPIIVLCNMHMQCELIIQIKIIITLIQDNISYHIRVKI